jgi:hypothetical protein
MMQELGLITCNTVSVSTVERVSFNMGTVFKKLEVITLHILYYNHLSVINR